MYGKPLEWWASYLVITQVCKSSFGAFSISSHFCEIYGPNNAAPVRELSSFFHVTDDTFWIEMRVVQSFCFPNRVWGFLNIPILFGNRCLDSFCCFVHKASCEVNCHISFTTTSVRFVTCKTSDVVYILCWNVLSDSLSQEENCKPAKFERKTWPLWYWQSATQKDKTHWNQDSRLRRSTWATSHGCSRDASSTGQICFPLFKRK